MKKIVLEIDEDTDITGWSPVMISAKIDSLRKQKERSLYEYRDYLVLLDEQIKYLQNALSNKDLCN